MDKKKKVGIAGVSSLLLVAMVIGVAVSLKKSNDGGSSSSGSVATSTKAAKAICAPTDYKEACESSLSNANTDDPKELIRHAFRSAEEAVKGVMKNSTLLQEAAKDPSTKGSFAVCSEVLQRSVDDLERSFEKIGSFEPAKIPEYVSSLRTWLSGSLTFQETCIDAFENTTGDTGEKMKQLLKKSRELTSNGLAMVTDLPKILSSLQLGNLGIGSSASTRRLLADSMENKARKLLATPLTPNAVVALDGSGQFKTIQEAINSIPPENNATFVIQIKAGVYKEYVNIPKKVNNVVFLGDGPTQTVISGDKNFADGVKTFATATVGVDGEGFFAKDIGFENTAGAEKHQAVALRVSGDMAVLYNVHINGYQDTLYAHNYRQYYRDCVITGTIDFIFGDSLAFFQNCQFIVRKPMANQACMVTAQGRIEPRSIGATVIQGGNITAEADFLAATPPLKAYLGRPWKELSRTLIMQTNIDGFIDPTGWAEWMGTFALDTLYYGEYENKGAGSDTTKRVTWKGIQKITPEIAETFTPGKSYQGDEWVTATGVPYNPGMF